MPRHLVVVKEHPAQNLAALGGRTATQLAGLGADIVLDDTRLGQDQFAVLQHRHFAHDIERAKFRAAGGAVEEIDKDRLPFRVRQGQGQGRLVGVSAFAKAIQFHGHVAGLPTHAVGCSCEQPGEGSRTFCANALVRA